jgi:hypothetical protein
MLKSYEAIYENGRIQWLKEKPPIGKVRIIVTMLEDAPSGKKRRSPSVAITGKGQKLGDIISPMIDDGDWDCLK